MSKFQFQKPPEDYNIGELNYDIDELKDNEPVGVEVPLTEDDISLIWNMAKTRVEAQQDEGTDTDWENATPNTLSVGDAFEDLEELDYVGVAGEYAFSKHFGLPLPYSSEERLDYGDIGYDFLIEIEGVPSSVSVDVKSSKRKDGRLIHPTDKQILSDLYVFAIVKEESVILKGYQVAASLENAPSRNDIFKTDTYYIDQRYLCEIPEKDIVTPVDTGRKNVKND